MAEKTSDGYHGVNFHTEFVSREAPTKDYRIRLLMHWCGVFDRENIAPPYAGGSFGNLSFRIKSGSPELIITASKSGLADSVTNDRFVKVSNVDFKTGTVYASGTREPSSEAMLHYAIYQARPEINAVFHGHCKPISDAVERLGIPITKREQPYGTVELVNEVLEVLGNNDFIEMRNHGFIALGSKLALAGKITCDMLDKCKK